MRDGRTRFSGKTVLITGAAQGLGAAYATAFAVEGADLGLFDLADPAEAAAAVAEAGGQSFAAQVDITDASALAEAVTGLIAEFGRIDVLINNASISGDLKLGPFTEIDSAVWDRVMAVNVRGSFECARAVVPQMRLQGGGKIINVASGTAFKGTPGLMHYVASKGAILAMTRAMARELGPDGICVNCLAPGLTLSDKVMSNPSWNEAAQRANIATRALARPARPGDLIGTVMFMASAESDFTTGQTFVVDGGSVMI